MKLIVPCNVCIKRFYRAYAEVEEGATDEEIRRAVTNAIAEHQSAELAEDCAFHIDPEDVVRIDIDRFCAWTEDDTPEPAEEKEMTA